MLGRRLTIAVCFFVLSLVCRGAARADSGGAVEGISGKDFYTNNNGRHHTWINLTHPQWSRVLTAPLVKTAGGLELCKPKDGKEPRLFSDKADADYQAMLAAMLQGREELYEKPRVDMPGAKPLPYPQNYAGPFTGFAGP